MALNGIQIFKLTPKKNCKECAKSAQAPQSEMTAPSNPHSSRRMSVRRCRFSQA